MAHLAAEKQSQQSDPRQVAQYVRKEPDGSEFAPAITLPDGSFRQQKVFKFADFATKSQNSLLRERKQNARQERKNMDDLIAAHLLKQNSKMDFSTYFQYMAPNKNLPPDLKKYEEVRQFMLLRGVGPIEVEESAVAPLIK